MVRKSTVEESPEKIGVGRFQYKLLLISGAVWASVAMRILATPYVIQSMIAARLTPTQSSLVASTLFAGMLLGSWPVGLLMESFGRKAWFIITVLVASMLSLMSAFAFGWVLVLLLRLAAGFVLGGIVASLCGVETRRMPLVETIASSGR